MSSSDTNGNEISPYLTSRPYYVVLTLKLALSTQQTIIAAGKNGTLAKGKSDKFSLLERFML